MYGDLIGQIDTVCQFCGEPCFIPLTRNMPEEILDAYLPRRVTMMATCEQGKALEKALLGRCYDDLLAHEREVQVTVSA
jgi:hypothetical protein